MGQGPSSYTEQEVTRLIGRYAEIRELRDTTSRGLRPLVWLADLDRALEVIPLQFWEVMLLHGLLGLPQDETARLLQISQQAVSKRFRQGLEEVVHLINGGE